MTISPFLILLPVLGPAFLLIATRQAPIAFSPLITCGMLSVALYLLGLLDWLGAGSSLLFWFATLCAPLALYLLWKRDGLRETVLSPAFCALVVLTFFHWLLFREAQYFKWDEFSHWGRAVRDMLGSHSLYGPDGNVQFLNYPPAMPLWNYFGAANTFYSEGNTYTFQFALLLAAMLPLFHGLKWRQWPQILAALAASLFLLNVLGHGWTSLYVDHVISAIFFGVMLMLIAGTQAVAGMAAESKSGNSRDFSPTGRGTGLGRSGQILWVLPCLVMLALVKDVGLYFAVCAGLFWLIRSRLMDRRLLQCSIAALLIAAPVVASVSWSWHVQSQNPPDVQRSLDIGDAFARVTAGPEEGREEVPGRFGTVFFSQETGSSEMMIQYNEFSWPMLSEYGDNLRPSSFGWIVIGLTLFAASWWQQPSTRSTIQLISGFMLTVTAVYFMMLLSLYLFVFPESAGTSIRSYIRFANIALLPFIGIAFAMLLPGFGHLDRRWASLPLAVITLLLFVSPPHFESLYSKPWQQELRAQMAPLIVHMRENTAASESIYLNVTRDQQFLEMLAVHDLTPQSARVDRNAYSGSDVAALAESIKGNAYAWFPVIDQSLGNAILPLIPEEHRTSGMGGVFRVVESDDEIQLLPVSFERRE